MQDSKVNTVQVPPTGTNPSVLIYATQTPMRVVVRNVGGTTIFLAHDTSVLQGSPPGLAGTFQLPAGASEVFVLQPKQGLFAAATGAGGIASIAVSEAIPSKLMES